MSDVKFAKGNKSAIKSSANVDGKLYFSTDSKELFLGTSTDKIKMSDIEVVAIEPDLQKMSPIEGKFYYVQATRNLYYYSGMFNTIVDNNAIPIQLVKNSKPTTTTEGWVKSSDTVPPMSLSASSKGLLLLNNSNGQVGITGDMMTCTNGNPLAVKIHVSNQSRISTEIRLATLYEGTRTYFYTNADSSNCANSNYSGSASDGDYWTLNGLSDITIYAIMYDQKIDHINIYHKPTSSSPATILISSIEVYANAQMAAIAAGTIWG